MCAAKIATADKVAVVVIHGMGEQRPMETLRGFVETLWERDASLFDGLDTPKDHANGETWSKPDRVSGSSELRRITTARARKPGSPGIRGVRVDFFELHWADLTADSTWNDFRVWFTRLLLRNPFGCEIPLRVLFVWLLLWLITIAVVLSGLSTALSKIPVLKDFALLSFLNWDGWGWVTVALLVVGATTKAFLTEYFGDVARYVSATPRNIKVRQSARERGLKLLRQLHDSGEYCRVVVVGHSLGSILAHDLVALAWADAANQIKFADNSPTLKAINDCEAAGLALLKARDEQAIPKPDVQRYDTGCVCKKDASQISPDFADRLAAHRLAQRVLFDALREEIVTEDGKDRSAWLISDLVTVGSPLAHASFLVARNACELRVMTRAREILRSPPVYETKKGSTQAVFTFRPSTDPTVTQLHHAAALAPVRWTNLHDVTGPWLFLQGDMISGPITQDYGPGATDLQVQPKRHGLLGAVFSRLFTHTLYWIYPRGTGVTTPQYVRVLRDAVNVLDDPDVERRLMDLVAEQVRTAAIAGPTPAAPSQSQKKSP